MGLGGCAAPSHELCKLHGMVDTFRWCDEGLSLACIADAQLVVFHYTELIFIDRELLAHTVSKADTKTEQALAPPLETTKRGPSDNIFLYPMFVYPIFI